MWQTVGWRRKFYNSTQPDILLVSNKTMVYEEEEEKESELQLQNNGTTTIKGESGDYDGAKNRETLEDFHDKFNITLAAGISPMLRSGLLFNF